MTTTPAVAAVLQDLVVDGTLTPVQASRVAERLTDPPTATEAPTAPAPDAPAGQPAAGGRIAEIAGYAGGSLLLGAVGLFLGNGWQDLSETSRVMIMTVTSLLLIAAGASIALTYGSVRALGRVTDSARRRLVSVLWTFAAGSAASAAGLSMNNHQHAHELVAASGAGLVVVGLGYALVPSAVAQFGAWVASIGLVCGLIMEFGDHRSTTPYAVAMFTLGAVWAGLAVTNLLREKQTGLALGAGLALFAGQLQVGDGSSGLGYALTAAVAIAGFAGFVLTRSWPVLGAGVLAMTLVVPEALHDWTNGSVSSAGSLLIAGLTLLGASAIGLRLRREVG